MNNDVRPPRPKQNTRQAEQLVSPPLHTLTAAEDYIPDLIPTQSVPFVPTNPPLDSVNILKSQGFRKFIPHTKKQRIFLIIFIILLAMGGTAVWVLTHHTHAVAVVSTQTTPQKKTVKAVIHYSTLSGLPITDTTVNQKPVTAVMIENSVAARPQSGLSDAGIVFEAVAEGGITRFMALYQDTAPDDVGPIRSARPYYVQWALGFQAAYAHVGGSTEALNDIKAWGVQDMNQFYNGSSYHRITSRDAPHNVYTSISTLNQLETAKGYHSTYTGLTRKKDKRSTQATAHTITMSLSGYTYDPSYTYNATTNSYDRSEAGSPQIDANTTKQLSPKVVIAMVIPESQGALDSSGAYYSSYNPIGSGQAYVFQDGTSTSVTWNKPSNDAPLTFTNSTGANVALNRGQTWITAITATNKVSYK